MDSLQTAVNAARPGTEIVVTGTYIGRLDIEGISGTSDHPITLRSDNRANLKSTKFDSALFIRGSSHIEIIGFTIDGGGLAHSVIGIGGRYGDKSVDPLGAPADHIRITDNLIQNSGQALLKVLHDSSDVLVSHNEFRDSGQEASGKYGEAIYLGSALIGPDNTHGIRIENNLFHSLTAEAVDIKSQGTYDITVENNVIHDLVWPDYGSPKYNNGAIAVGQQRDGAGGDQLTTLGYNISGNWIWNVSESNPEYQDASGIQAWSPATIRANVIFSIDNSGIEIRDTYRGTSVQEFRITDNVIWNSGSKAGFDGISIGTLTEMSLVVLEGNFSSIQGVSNTAGFNPPPANFRADDSCW